MKTKLAFFTIVVCHSFILTAQTDWKIAGDKIVTQWAEKVDPKNPLPEYPRPQLVRTNNWISLNGLWQYNILSKSDNNTMPATYAGNILVPYAVESALSGVGKTVGKDSVLWYKRIISVPANLRNKELLLHFGAVDWQADVYVNGSKVASHQGGYDPFSVDITGALKKGLQQEIAVRVWDPTDAGPQPRGKQVTRPSGIWYNSVTGIWQTVWLEVVPKTYISSTTQTPNVDKQAINISAAVENAQPGDQVLISVWDGETRVANKVAEPGKEVSFAINNAKLWSPSSPFLYDVRINVQRKNKIIDDVKSYFGMRKISIKTDSKGVQRIMLNNEFLFQYGPLDQGWWPDGLYTAPTDEALKFDIEKTKEIGFNMIRKHVKVEPARWYNYCDKLGVLVWQDMPSGDLGGHTWDSRPGIIGHAKEKNRTPQSEAIYREEWAEIMKDLHNFPSIVVWVPFNEAWGQFKTTEITNWTMMNDPSRLVNQSSGGNFYGAGDMIDLHNYPEPAMPEAKYFGAKQAIVLGEFGGLGLPLQNHTWIQRNWGYQSFGTADSLFMQYQVFMNSLRNLIPLGLSAAVYTQTTDVETETNGLFTYDRRVLKMPLDRLKPLHQSLYNPALVK